ncbi:MAG TPA: hypothetical protein VHI13_01040 [Candidatus Kapabacteria bacterium]|nr:hypothetical protein [Candidatus Kapabacteria bacterium]
MGSAPSVTRFLRAATVVLIAALWAPVLRAQVPQFNDSLLRRQRVTATTERYAATHTTSLLTDYLAESAHSLAHLRLALISTTTLVGDPSTRDQVDAAIDAEYRLPSAFRPFVIAEGTLTNDARRDALIPGMDNIASTFLGVGGRVVDAEGNRLGLAVGGAYSRQVNVADAGGGIYGELEGHYNLAGYDLRLSGRGRWYNIAPKHNSNAYFDVLLDRSFEEGGRLSLGGRYEIFGTDSYNRRNEEDVLQYGGPTFDALQSRDETHLRITSSMGYPIADDLAFDALLTVGNQLRVQRQLTDGLPPLPRDPDLYRYSLREFSISGSAGLRWTPPRMTVTVRMDYNTTEQTNIVDPNGTVSDQELQRKRVTNAINDFTARQILLGGTAEYRVSRYDTIQANASIGIYRYDTPSSQNFFDRDEQSIQAQLCYAHQFSPVLGFTISGQAFLTHLVYLFGQNSNDNNWNRLFRLSPVVSYVINDRLRNFLETEVVANYTEYDFQGRTQNVRGRSFRELHLRDSLILQLTHTLRFGMQGDLRVSERGSFSWEQFAESPLERTRTEGVEADLGTTSVERLDIAVGGRLSRVKNFRADPRTAIMQPFSDRTSIGPTALVTVQLSERTDVRFTGWWEHRFEDSRLVARVPILFLTVGMKL